MRSIQFNHVFVTLMTIALLSAFVFPKAHSDALRAQLQTLFITRPVHSLAHSVAAKLRGGEAPDPEAPRGVTRSYREVAEENRALRVAIAHLAVQLEQLRYVNEDREAIGAMRQFCRPLRVTGNDSAMRRSLIVQGDVQGLRPGMPALYAGGLAGKLDRVGWSGGAQVQLLTDRACRVTARFGRLQDGQFSLIGNLSGLVEGDGRDGMLVRSISMREASERKLAAGDWAVLSDGEYPQPLQGYRIGEIVSIAPSRSYPLFAEIQLRPLRDLQTLREVLIYTR